MQDHNIHPECDYWASHRQAGLPELLAPAGSLEHLKVAIKAGADAVYMGGQQFGARAYAENLNIENLKIALHYAHFHGRRLFLTVNTLMKEEEINQILYGFLLPYYEAGLDGVIVQDLGTASFIHKTFPDMEIHASTQMTITHASGARGAQLLGINRIVPARELSFREIAKIKKETGLELEVFVHGALCFCYSGQCLLSSFYGGRSGNRGRCAQPCRLPYVNASGKEAYFLSPRDLCSIELLPRLIETGVDSLKIEGRMKNVDYVAGVTGLYRKYLDLYARLKEEGHPEDYRVLEEDSHALQELYCRGEFTEGYWRKHNGPEMMAVDTQKNLGRRIGQIRSVGKHDIRVRLESFVHPKDILVIPTGKNEETVLTVPANPPAGKQIPLNVPDVRKLRPSMDIYRRRNEELSEEIRRNIIEKEIRYPVKARVLIRQGIPMKAELYCRGVQCIVQGAAAEAARKKAVSKEDVNRQFAKTGTTPFTLEECLVDLQADSFVSLSALKKLRQDAYGALLHRLEAFGDRDKKEIGSDDPTSDFAARWDSKTGRIPEEGTTQTVMTDWKDSIRERIAVVYDAAVLESCLSLDFYSAICLPMDMWDQEELLYQGRRTAEAGKKALLSLPAVMRHGLDDWDGICIQPFWSGIYAHNINEAYYLSRLKGAEGKCIAGTSFYHWNRHALNISRQLFGFFSFQLPLELSSQDLEALLITDTLEDGLKRRSGGASDDVSRKAFEVPAELIVYGRRSLMLSAQCQKKMAGRCDHKKETLWLKDPHHRKLPVTTHCDYCYNKIWSHEPENRMEDDFSEIGRNISRFSFDFFGSGSEVPRNIMEQFQKWEQNGYHGKNRKKG